VSGQYIGPEGDLGRLLAPLRAVPGARISTGELAYERAQALFAGCLHLSPAACHTVGSARGGTLPRMSFRARSDYVTRPVSAAGARAMVSAAERRLRGPGSGALLLDAYGGVINRVAPDATAFVHRGARFCIQYLTYDGGHDWLRSAWRSLRPYVSGQAYQNYIDPELPSWREAYYGANLPRLEEIRRAVDPEHRFNFPQAIGRGR
jgi:FAD/FMN-containing dehydrogenase